MSRFLEILENRLNAGTVINTDLISHYFRNNLSISFTMNVGNTLHWHFATNEERDISYRELNKLLLSI